MPKDPRVKKTAKGIRTVPYANGFHLPSQKEKLYAIGFKGKQLPKEYSDHFDEKKQFFKPIPPPTSIDDWLAQYVEEEQSYGDFLQENPWFSWRKHKFMRQTFVPSGKNICDKYPDGKIYIAKVGTFSTDCGVNFDDLLTYVRQFLCMPVEVLEGIDINESNGELFFVVDPNKGPSGRSGARIRKSTIQTRHDHKTKHKQLRVDSILPKMGSILPDDALCLIALTNYDLYGDNTDLFVAGMAAGSNRVAIFSLFRYNPTLTFSQEFWYSIHKTNTITDKEFKHLMLQRTCKLLVHEIGHLLGVGHCTYYSCCMNGSGHLEEDFRQPMTLCPVDLHKLQTLIGFDIQDRYKNLLQFYMKHDMKEEASWVERRLQFIVQSDIS